MVEKPENMNQIWAENGEIVDPGADVIDAGWPTLDPETGDPAPPPHTYMNFIQNKITKFIAHVNEYGIAVWDATTTYTTDSWARSPVDNKVYVSTIDNNIGYEPSANSAKWSKFDISANIGDTLESYESANIMQTRGYLEMNGQAVSRTTYAELFALIGTKFGAGDGSTTFNLPNKALDGFELIRDDFPSNGRKIKIFLDGSMLVMSDKTAFSSPGVVGYFYDNYLDNSYNSITLSPPDGKTIRGEWVFSSDDSAFFVGAFDGSHGAQNEFAAYEYRGGAMHLIPSEDILGGETTQGLFFVSADRKEMGTVYQNSGQDFTTPESLYFRNLETGAKEVTTLDNSEYNQCDTFSTKEWGVPIYVVEENKSYHFFGGRAAVPSFQSYTIYGGDPSTRAFTPCSVNPDFADFIPSIGGYPAYYNSVVYSTGVLLAQEPAGVIYTIDVAGNVDQICEAPPGSALAGIVNGQICTSQYVPQEGLYLYRNLPSPLWIKAL